MAATSGLGQPGHSTLQVLHDIAAHRDVGTRDHARAALAVDAATRSINRLKETVWSTWSWSGWQDFYWFDWSPVACGRLAPFAGGEH